MGWTELQPSTPADGLDDVVRVAARRAPKGDSLIVTVSIGGAVAKPLGLCVDGKCSLQLGDGIHGGFLRIMRADAGAFRLKPFGKDRPAGRQRRLASGAIPVAGPFETRVVAHEWKGETLLIKLPTEADDG